MFRTAGFVLFTRRPARTHIRADARPIHRRALSSASASAADSNTIRLHANRSKRGGNARPARLALDLPAILPVAQLPPCAPQQRHPEGTHSGEPPPERHAPRKRPRGPLTNLPVVELPLPGSMPTVPDGHIDIRAAG